MPRFFVPPEQIRNQKFTLLGSEARHASLVLRKKAGDLIDLFDGKDLSYQGRIESVAPERVDGLILSQEKTKPGSNVDVVLYQALIKGPKWDWLVEKACEVGVAKLIPIVTARTIIKPSGSGAIERSKRIALAASKQCGRSGVMEIVPAIPFQEAIQEESSGVLSIIPWEKESAKTIRQACQGFKGKRIRIFVGPEGGWENDEVVRAGQQGLIPVRLGPTLLRSETAGIVASTLVLSECGVYD